MTVKIFYSKSMKNSKEIVKYFDENGIEYTTQNIIEEPLTWNEFKTIIEMAEDGIDSIISGRKSKEAKEIIDSIDFDELTLKQFYDLTIEHPCIIRTPITINRNNLMFGYNQDETCLFRSRKDKKARFNQLLESVRAMESYSNEQFMRYSL